MFSENTVTCCIRTCPHFPAVAGPWRLDTGASAIQAPLMEPSDPKPCVVSENMASLRTDMSVHIGLANDRRHGSCRNIGQLFRSVQTELCRVVTWWSLLLPLCQPEPASL